MILLEQATPYTDPSTIGLVTTAAPTTATEEVTLITSTEQLEAIPTLPPTLPPTTVPSAESVAQPPTSSAARPTSSADPENQADVATGGCSMGCIAGVVVGGVVLAAVIVGVLTVIGVGVALSSSKTGSAVVPTAEVV